MRLNTTTDYAIRMMLYLAEKGKTASATELSESITVSTRYTLQIAAKLRDGGLLDVRHGALGGYCLARPADQINVYDILLLMEGPVEISRQCEAGIEKYAVLSCAYSELEAYITGYLKMMTLEVLTKNTRTQWHELLTDMAGH